MLYFPSAAKTTILIAAISLTSISTGCNERAASLPVIPHVLILHDSRLQNDTNLKAYAEVFGAVSLTCRKISPEDVKSVVKADTSLILAVPGNAARALNARQIKEILHAVESGVTLITEEITPLSQALGFRVGPISMVRETEELAYPDVMIRWPRQAEVTSPMVPAGALILNRDRHSGNALVVLMSHGNGRCLLLASPLDPEYGDGYKRFPYLLQELARAGVVFPFRSERLSALFDYSYRLKADLPSLARNWRDAGIASLHVGAWDFFNLNSDKKSYLHKLIEESHKNGILVYAWLELPHVSGPFWNRHPKWREKTATGRDAQVDWRSLMNLEDPDCFKAMTEGLQNLLLNFDWDGVDIAELYFESPDGPIDPDNFTPMNNQVRDTYRGRFGIDPKEFFREDSKHYWKTNPADWAKFIEFRVNLERDLNQRVLQFLSDLRRNARPSLELILLYVDNISDPTMREGVGADLTVMLPLLDKYDFTLVMEDPWTVWHLGPRRYAELAKTYARYTSKTDRLGIDINIVDRAQEVFPTQKQTGSEFLQLFHYAGLYFPTVMAYSEWTMYPQDLELVSNALAAGVSVEASRKGVRIASGGSVIFRMKASGEVLVDGTPWPCVGPEGILLPKGSHDVSVGKAIRLERPRLIRLNGTLLDARYVGENGIDFSYESRAKGIALFDRPLRSFQVDGSRKDESPAADSNWLMMPAGLHRLRAFF